MVKAAGFPNVALLAVTTLLGPALIGSSMLFSATSLGEMRSGIGTASLVSNMLSGATMHIYGTPAPLRSTYKMDSRVE